MRSEKDPITGLKTRLLDWGIISEDELKKIDKDIRASVEQAVEEAKASPEPEPGDEMWKVSAPRTSEGPQIKGAEEGLCLVRTYILLELPQPG